MKQQSAEQKFQALLDVAVDAVVIIDRHGYIEAFNGAAEQLFGYAATEVLGLNVSMLMPAPHEQQHDRYLQRYLHLSIPHIIGTGRELQVRHKNGTLISVWLSVGQVRNSERESNGPYFVGFLHDLTFRHRAAEEERRTAQRLGEISHLKAMADMAEGIAHEINQPLAAIANYAAACQRMLAAPDTDTTDLQAVLTHIVDQALRAGDSIHRLRELMHSRKRTRTGAL